MEQNQVLKLRQSRIVKEKYVTYHLGLQTCFGCQQTPLPSNSFIVSSSIIYINDGCLIMHSILQGTKKFLWRLEVGQVVTSMSCNQSMEFVMALGISKQNSSYILVYDSKNSLTIKHHLPNNHYVVDLHFYAINQFAVLAFGEGEKYIFVKRFYRNNGLSFSQARESPKRKTDKTVKKITGEYQGMLYLVSNDQMMSVCHDDFSVETIKMKVNGFVDYIVYSNDQIIVLTKQSIALWQRREIIQQIFLKDIIQGDSQGFCLLKLTKRFIIGHKNSISLSVFSFDGLKIKFVDTYKIKQRIRGGIYSMHGSFEEMNIGLTVYMTNKADDISVDKFKPLPKDVYLEHIIFGLTSINTQKIVNPFTRLFKNQIEYGDIINVEGALVPECYILAHRTLTVYNYNIGFKVEQKFFFTQSPLQVCVHPLAHQIVCFFKDCFKVYYRLQSQLLEVKKQHKICSTGSFSSRGLLALAVCNKNHYDIQLYDICRFQTYKTLFSVSNKTPITRINWIKQDTQLELYSNSQFLIVDIKKDMKQVQFVQKKGHKILEYDSNSELLLVSTDNSTVKLYGVEQGTRELASCLVEVQFSDETVRSAYIDKTTGLLFFGMSSGTVKWCEWPWVEYDAKEIVKQFLELSVSSSPIVKLFTTINSKYTLTISQNNAVTVLRTKKKKNGKLLNYEIDIEFSNFRNIKLFQTNIVTSMRQKIRIFQDKQMSLNNELDEFRSIWEIHEKKRLESIDSENKSIQQKHHTQLLLSIEYNRKKKNQINKNFGKLNETKLIMETKVKQQQEKEMLRYYQQVERLDNYKQQLKQKMNKEYQQAQRYYEFTLTQVENDFEEKITTMKQRFQNLKFKLDERRAIEQIVKEQTKQEKEQLKRVQKMLIANQQIELKKVIIELRGKMSKLKRQNERFEGRKEFLENKMKHLELQLEFQTQESKQLDTIKQTLDIDYRKIQKTTYSYEQALNKLSIRNNSLVNFRNVYLNLQNTLNEQIKTLDTYNSEVSSNIKKMNTELVEVLYTTKNLDQRKEQIQKQINTKKKLIERYEKPRIVINSICNDIYHQLHLQTPETQETNVQQIYQKFFNNIQYINNLAKRSLTSLAIDDDTLLKNKQTQKFQRIKQNLIERKQYYQNSIQCFEYQHKVLDKSLSGAFNKLQTHNSKLIAECNGLKEQLQKKSKTLNQLFSTLRTIDCMNLDMVRDPYFTYEYEESKTKKDKDLMEWFPEEEAPAPVHRSGVRTSQSHTRNNKKKIVVRQSQNDQSFTGSRLLSVRRVMTANQNNRDRYLQRELKDMEQIQSTVPSKPATNQGMRKSRNQWRSKSKKMGDRNRENTSVTGFSLFDERIRQI